MRYTDLMIDNIVVTFVDAFAVRPILERLGDVLDIRDAVNERADRPARVPTLHAVEIYFKS